MLFPDLGHKCSWGNDPYKGKRLFNRVAPQAQVLPSSLRKHQMGIDSDHYHFSNMYHHHTKHSPSSRAADISRLLDPAYSPSNTTPTKAAYVDHHGDLHDPDFRHFPSASSSSRNSPTKRRAASTHSASHAFARPQWELGTLYDDVDEFALDEDEDDDASNSNNHYDSYASPFSQRASRYVRDPYSRTSPIYTYSSYHYPTSTYSYASSPVSSSPISYSSDETALNDSPSDGSPLSDEPLPLHRRCVSRLRASRPRHRSQSRDEKRLSESIEEAPTRRSIESARSEARTLAPGNNDAEEEEEEPQEEFTPTCAQALKRQWSCLALRWRLGVFRAKKKVRRRLSAVVHQ